MGNTVSVHPFDEAQFVDVLLVQTLITFLLYFVPTPGASGVAELTSAIVMSVYVPIALTPLYIMIWRLILSYFTIAFGFFVLWRWVGQGLRSIGEGRGHEQPEPGSA